MSKRDKQIAFAYEFRADGTRAEQVIEVPIDCARAPGDEAVDGKANGMCGTDLEIRFTRHGHGNPPRRREWILPGFEKFQVMGHEGLGRRVRDGKLVVPVVRRPCDDACCTPCRHDRYDQCATRRYVEAGIDQLHGFARERYYMPPSHLVEVPDGMGLEAVLAEPWSCAFKAGEHAMLLGGVITPGWPEKPKTALVLGAGAVGLGCAVFCKLQGWKTVVLGLEPAPNPRADLIRLLGHRYVSLAGDLGYVRPGPEFEDDAWHAAHAQRVTEALRGFGAFLEGRGFERFSDPLVGFDVGFGACGDSATELAVWHKMAPCSVFAGGSITAANRSYTVPSDSLNLSDVLGNRIRFGWVNAHARHYLAALNAIKQMMALDQWPLKVITRVVRGVENAPTLFDAVRDRNNIKVVLQIADL